MSGNAAIIRLGTPTLLALVALAGCGGNSFESKVGGAWPSEPVKCSAYAQGGAEYAACLERDREASASRRPERREAKI
jgi:hypothetical protein